jgi:hypothetical protein
MRNLVLSGLILISSAIAQHINAHQAPVEKGLQSISSAAIRAQLSFLASDWMEGREAGTKGEYMAGDYIASMLQLYGVKPAGDQLRPGRNTIQSQPGDINSYFQNFVLVQTYPGDEQSLMLKTSQGKTLRTTHFTYNVDYAFRPSDQGLEIEAPVVFAGYGFVSSKAKYNDFAKLDLKGKAVLKISGPPPSVSSSLSAAELNAAVRESDALLREMGAACIIEVAPGSVVTGPFPGKDFLNMSPSEGRPSTGRPYASYSIPGKNSPATLPRIQISVRTANEILKGSGTDIDSYVAGASRGSIALPDLSEISIVLKSAVTRKQLQVRNIIGVIEGNNPDEIIVLGAHYDHMGTGNGFLWNGADDNASGTVGIMTIAKAICDSGRKPEKTIVIALWTAEEEGLLGSRYWVQNPTHPLGSVKLNLNFDMISRYISDDAPDKLTMTYTDKYPFFKELTLNNIKKHKIDLDIDFQPSADPPGGSDHRSFTAAGIPVMRFKPGHREEYHTPGDEIATVDWDIMEKIIRIGYANIWELANSKW